MQCEGWQCFCDLDTPAKLISQTSHAMPCHAWNGGTVIQIQTERLAQPLYRSSSRHQRLCVCFRKRSRAQNRPRSALWRGCANQGRPPNHSSSITQASRPDVRPTGPRGSPSTPHVQQTSHLEAVTSAATTQSASAYSCKEKSRGECEKCIATTWPQPGTPFLSR